MLALVAQHGHQIDRYYITGISVESVYLKKFILKSYKIIWLLLYFKNNNMKSVQGVLIVIMTGDLFNMKIIDKYLLLPSILSMGIAIN